MNKVLNQGNMLFTRVIPWLMLLVGMYMLPMQIMKNDLSKIPGDSGDARFNNYILEHGHLYMTGAIQDYWNAPFMYPYKNTIAMSDNLLGTVPIYSFFRQVGADRETAFQLWILSMFALSYLCCLFVLNKLTDNMIISACGAYIFAFGIYNVGQMFHAQIFPRFIAPLTIYWLYSYLNSNKTRYFGFMMAGIVYQFYCGIYLGFILFYFLLFIGISYILLFHKSLKFDYLKSVKVISTHLAIIFLSIILLFVLFRPYIQISDQVGFRSWEEVIGTIPRLRSYFFTSPASLLWSPLLYNHSAYKFDGWWNHFLFIGILPWITVLIAPFLIFSKKKANSYVKPLGVFTLGLTLAFIFCYRTHGVSLWKLFFELPGFASMRSLDRIINIESVLFVILFALTIKALTQISNKSKFLLLLLPFVTIADNLIKPEDHKSFFKNDAIAAVNTTRQKILNSHNDTFQVIAFTPVFYDNSLVEKDQIALSTIHLNAMLACQELGLACVNGYSGFEPGNFSDFFQRLNKSSLIHWLAYNEAQYDKVEIINGFKSAVIDSRYINLRAPNGNFLCADGTNENTITANKDVADLWETFKLIRFANGNASFLCYNNNFFSSNLNKKGLVTATKSIIYDWETYRITTIDENHIAIMASNGKYLECNLPNYYLEATDSTISETSTFELLNH